ncbi:hypothetical protein ACTVZO_16180 [Streptomyces sp. IBSNAI002]|uniref:hypothetical protein n=1 Tax=Streptomyces sp. IBSNAI002 TaxID=3457500 RepID=UPI003FD59714
MNTTESFQYAGHVGLSFGTVYFERLAEEPNAKPWAASARPWVTAYRITGPRIRGTVRITPVYDEASEDDWEFLPSGFYVGYGRAHYAACEGDLEVWDSRLTEGVHVYPKRTAKREFPVRRRQTGIGDYPAPAGVRDKTRELIGALVELHQDEAALLHEKAAAYARHQREARIAAVEKESREIEELLQTLNARAGTLTMRRIQMSGHVFEKTLADLTPTT